MDASPGAAVLRDTARHRHEQRCLTRARHHFANVWSEQKIHSVRGRLR